jgi:hypothetical protein
MTSVAEVATGIASAGVPLLYLDTCALLDIVRGHRDAFGRDHARAAVKLVELVEAKSLTLVLPEQITNELTDNFAEVQKSGTASIAALIRLPFLADDLFVNFDDERSEAGFRVLAELAKSTQVLFFTHHPHLASIARSVVGADVHSECSLA